MNIYVLHFGAIDSMGELCIDCLKFDLREEAIIAQTKIIEEFKMKYADAAERMIEEKIGLFARVMIKDEFTEIQTHIEQFEV